MSGKCGAGFDVRVLKGTYRKQAHGEEVSSGLYFCCREHFH